MCAREVKNDEVKFDINFARQIHFIEKEYSFLVYSDYDYFKFISQVDYMTYLNNEQKKREKKSSKK